MDIEILKSEKRYMEFYIIGEGHTFCNVLRSILAESEHVKRVSYTVEHPITHRLKPRFEIETQGRRRPETALRRAAERLSETCDELSGEFEAALG
jgi:DNA-directed RNA polymerase subunit L